MNGQHELENGVKGPRQLDPRRKGVQYLQVRPKAAMDERYTVRERLHDERVRNVADTRARANMVAVSAAQADSLYIVAIAVALVVMANLGQRQ